MFYETIRHRDNRGWCADVPFDAIGGGGLARGHLQRARLAVLVVRAYGLVMASNYGMRTRPPAILAEGEGWQVIRRRETWDDLLALERIAGLSDV